MQYTLIDINSDVQYLFNGALYLVRHKSVSSQFIGSGKTYGEAMENAEKTRGEILSKRRA